MCGRYALHADPTVIALQFGLAAAPALEPRYNVCPGTDILAVREDDDGRRLANAYRWGLHNKLANARGETVADKPAFRSAFRQRRCLVPASGFYEWSTAASKKQPYYIRPTDGTLFGLAAIAELWDGPKGPVRTLSLITTEPNELIRSIHERMPVIIAPGDYAAWLDRGNHDAKRFIRSYLSERMEAYPVSPRVNGPKHDDPALIEAA